MKKNDKIKVSILLVFCILLCFALFFRPDFSVKEGVSGTSLNYSLSITNGSMQGNTYGTDWGTKDGINYAWGGTLTAPSLTVYGNTLPTYCWMKVLPNTGYKYGSTTGGTYSSNIYTSQSFSVNASGTLDFVIKTIQYRSIAGSGGTVTPTAYTAIDWENGYSIKATPNAGYHFVNWTATLNPSYITISNVNSDSTAVYAVQSAPDGGQASATANFAKNTGTVYVVAGTGGSVSPSSFSQTVGAAGTTITATPSAGYHFTGWTATTNPSYITIANTASATTTVTATTNMPDGGTAAVTANFAANTGTVTVSAGTGGSVSPSSFSQTYGAAGTTITATPDSGYAFSGWTLTTNPSYLTIANASSATTTIMAATSMPDGGSATVTASFVILNQAPTNISLSSSTVLENKAVNTVIGTLSTTDPDSGDTFTYTISGTDAASFNISGSSLRTSSVFDFETKSSYSITIRTTDQGGLYYEKAFTITVMNVNETPTDITLSASSIAENNIVNAVIGTLSTTDPDSGNTFTYTISGTDAASFNISGSSLRASVIFDFETKSSYSITITTTDQGGLAYAKAFTITVTNVNEAPTDISLSASTIPENSAVNTVIGTLSTTDPDSGNTFTYTIVAGGDGTSFNISGTSLRNSSVFDFETKNSYSVTVRTTDQGGLTFDKTFIITVTNVNEAPTDITLSANTIPENSAINTVIGALTSTDVDSSSFTYTLVSGDTTAFNISGSNLRANAIYDYETKNSYSITIRTSDGSLTFDKTFTITVTNVNEAPTGITLSSSSIPENSAIGTTIGTLSSTDPDAGNTFTYTIVTGGDGASFSISGTSLKSAAVFNYEVKSSYSVTIRTTDQGGLTFDKAFTITVTNVNDAPSDIALSSNSIIENKAAGTSIGTFSSTDEDNTTGFVYTIVGGADATSFSISGSNLLSAAVFDYETKNSYSITIRTTDTGGAYYEKAFTISIVNDTEEYTFNVVNAGTSNSSYYSTTLGPSGAYGSGTITYSGGNNTYDYNEQAVITITPAAGCFVYGIAYADNPSVRIYSAGGVVRNGGFKGSYTFTTNVTANKTILVYFQKIGDLKLNGVSNLDDAIIIGAKWQDASYYTLNAEGQHSVDSGGTSWEYFNSTLGYICPDINYDTHANDFDASLVMQYFEN